MKPSKARVLITFDTNLAGVWNTRAFWATLCEEIGQSMVLTPTATTEVLRRIRLESEREWTKKLRVLAAPMTVSCSAGLFHARAA